MGLLNTLKNQDTGPLVGRLWREHISQYQGWLVLAFFCMGITAASTALMATMLQPLFDEVFVAKNESMLYIMAGAVFVVSVAKGIASFGDSAIMVFVGQRIIADIQKRLFEHFMRADLAYFHARSSGELISRFTNDITMMRQAVTTALTGIGKDSLSLLFLIAVMFYQDMLLASLAFFVFPVAVIPLIKIGKRMRKVSNNNQVEMGEFTILLNQVFQGMRVVKSYAMEAYETTRIHHVIENLFWINFKGGRARSASHPIMEALGGVAIVIVILYGGSQVIDGTRTVGAFGSFIAALLLAYEPLKRLVNLNANLQEGLAGARRVFEALDSEPSLTTSPQALDLVVSKGSIQFDHVSFSYASSKVILPDLSFQIEAGKRVAFVGSSGSGKSTILNLIPRFYDVTGGSILVDGQDVRQVTTTSLRKHIALVSQEITLFDDTVRANIAYGKLDASDEEIIAAAKASASHEFIQNLPQGYDTVVGEQGVRLSGGQRQRLSIARAMLKNAPILLLDEATSSLDTESERQVQTALNKLMEGRTSVVVAHRLSTIYDCDWIYVLDGGHIIEQGQHDDLMSLEGAYAKLVNLQSHILAEAS